MMDLSTEQVLGAMYDIVCASVADQVSFRAYCQVSKQVWDLGFARGVDPNQISDQVWNQIEDI